MYGETKNLGSTQYLLLSLHSGITLDGAQKARWDVGDDSGQNHQRKTLLSALLSLQPQSYFLRQSISGDYFDLISFYKFSLVFICCFFNSFFFQK